MRRSTLQIALLFAVLSVLGVLPALAQQASTVTSLTPQLTAAKSALEKYQDPMLAVRDGYFSTVGCIDFPTAGTLADMPYPAGGMGVHFFNPKYVGAALDPSHPQVLLYEPVADNKLALIAAEWLVPVGPGVTRPSMFGQQFYGPMEGHYPVMPRELVHYDMHVWLFKNNPAGVFSPTNPDVKCPIAGYTYHDATPKMPMGHL